MLKQREFIFMRHGETDWNVQGRAQGTADTELNQNGLEQAERAAEVLAEMDIAGIAHSPLSRARETAWIVNEALGVPMSVVEDLRECSWGEYEGRERGAWWEQWKAGTLVLPGAETYEDFLKRALSGVNQALATFPEGRVLIIAHGGIFWSVRHHAHLPGHLRADNCAPIHLRPPSKQGAPWWHNILNFAL